MNQKNKNKGYNFGHIILTSLVPGDPIDRERRAQISGAPFTNMD